MEKELSERMVDRYTKLIQYKNERMLFIFELI